MPTKDEALNMAIGKLVLEKMTSGNDVPVSRCTITNVEIHALSKEALEQPAQEPVAWVSESTMDNIEYWKNKTPDDCIEVFCAFYKDDEFNIPLYTHPHQWQGLTDDERIKCYELSGHKQDLRPQDRFAVFEFANAIEQALKEKNHG